MDIAYLNGDFAPLGETRVSVLDRGFLFGDGVYEVIPVYAGQLFRLSAHLDRLENSLAGIKLANPSSRAQWMALLAELVERNGDGDQLVYFQVTRGAAPRNHKFPSEVSPSVFAMSNPASKSPGEPVSAITREDYRWRRCDIKSIALLANVLLRQEAQESGSAEAILLRDGYVTEGAATNVFTVSDEVIYTPPKGPLLLPGITRDFIVELCNNAGLQCLEAPIAEAELRAADEVWISSSSMEVAPVIELDGRPVGTGKPGPRWERAYRLFQDHKHRETGSPTRTDAA